MRKDNIVTKLDRVLDALSACTVEIERLEGNPNPTDDEKQQLTQMKRERRLLTNEANGYQLTLWSVYINPSFGGDNRAYRHKCDAGECHMCVGGSGHR